MEKKLGKGIGALIPEKPTKPEGVATLKVNEIRVNKYQPRKNFNPDKLVDLINSIREKGVIQPVVVRPSMDGYELIAGERRFRAIKELGLEDIPAIVKEVSDADSLELSLIENIQREELNSMEEANAYKKLIDEFGFSQDEVSKAVGKDKSTVSNMLRLLALPQVIKKFLEDNLITTGHAKAILALSTEREKIKLAKKVINNALSVRQVEELVKSKGKTKPLLTGLKDDTVIALEERLQHLLGTRIKIKYGKKRGTIEIQYYSNEDLERIINFIEKGKS